MALRMCFPLKADYRATTCVQRQNDSVRGKISNADQDEFRGIKDYGGLDPLRVRRAGSEGEGGRAVEG